METKKDSITQKIIEGYRLAVRRLLENRAKEDGWVIDTCGRKVKARQILKQLDGAK